jgi:hypothetical protein
MSHITQHSIDSARYAKCVEVSKRIRRDTDRDVIRGRQFDFGKTFLPEGLSKVARLPFLSADEKRLFSQVQGRTYAKMFALVERFIGAKVLEISRSHWLGDQVALEALVRLKVTSCLLMPWGGESGVGQPVVTPRSGWRSLRWPQMGEFGWPSGPRRLNPRFGPPALPA